MAPQNNNSTAAPVIDTAAPVTGADVPVTGDGSTVEEIGRGDLVELHDGAYAIVLDTDPLVVLRIGHPQAYELPVRKVA